MNQRNIKKLSTFEAAVTAIGEYIIGRGLQPGDVLPPEPSLASSLGISRNILREALRHYRTLGLIESKPKVGTILMQVIFQFLHRRRNYGRSLLRCGNVWKPVLRPIWFSV